jgi:hypothetical protein
MKSIENHECYSPHNFDVINVDKLIKNIPDQSHEIIDQHSFYLIYALKLDDVSFPQPKDFVTGEVLLHAQKYKIPFIMLAKISPVMIQEIDAKTPIQELYECDDITDIQKKDICNVTSGICNKKYQKRDTAEIEPNDKFDTGFMRKLDDDHVLLVHKKKIKLTENYLPVGKLIFDKSRINLHKITSIINPYIRAINVDAIEVSPKNQHKCNDILKQHGYLQKTK